MSNVVQLPIPKPRERALTCGCGSQTFILVCEQSTEKPEFIYCTECRMRIATANWTWTPE